MENKTNAKPDSLEEIFGKPIYAYTRAQALSDGLQVEVPARTSREAGLRYPVYMTRAVWDKCVEIPKGVDGQDIEGRLWDVVWMLSVAIRRSRNAGASLAFELYVRNDNRRPRLVSLRADVGPVDCDNAAPAITICLPDED